MCIRIIDCFANSWSYLHWAPLPFPHIGSRTKSPLSICRLLTSIYEPLRAFHVLGLLRFMVAALLSSRVQPIFCQTSVLAQAQASTCPSPRQDQARTRPASAYFLSFLPALLRVTIIQMHLIFTKTRHCLCLHPLIATAGSSLCTTQFQTNLNHSKTLTTPYPKRSSIQGSLNPVKQV